MRHRDNTGHSLLSGGGGGGQHRYCQAIRFLCTSATNSISGFLIVGGYREGNQGSAEIFNPAIDQSCPLGDLKEARHAHTLCNRMVCGGFSDDTSQNCELFAPPSTFTSLPVRLLQRRSYHLCWGLRNGDVLLLGGAYSNTSLQTTERVSADGSGSSAAFNLSSGIS